MLIPPSTAPYNFTQRELGDTQLNIDPSAGQSQAVKDILAGFVILINAPISHYYRLEHLLQHCLQGPNGFFIECGANDGEWYTNTLWVERNMGWRGILVEADPRPFKKLLQKHRKAYIGKFCLSTTPHPQIVSHWLTLRKSYCFTQFSSAVFK